MTRYAEGTSVPADRTRGEIEALLNRYDATEFVYGHDRDRNIAMLMFRMRRRRIRFLLPMPDPYHDDFRFTPSKKYERTEPERVKAYEQATRQRWRALKILVLAKLEAVETGITEFDREFLAHIVTDEGDTIGDVVAPMLDSGASGGDILGALLPGARELPARGRT